MDPKSRERSRGAEEGFERSRNESFERSRNESFERSRNEGFERSRNEGFAERSNSAPESQSLSRQALPTAEDQLERLQAKLQGTSEIERFEQEREDNDEAINR